MSKDPSWSLQGLKFLQNILSRRSEAGIGVQAQLLKLDKLWRQNQAFRSLDEVANTPNINGAFMSSCDHLWRMTFRTQNLVSLHLRCKLHQNPKQSTHLQTAQCLATSCCIHDFPWSQTKASVTFIKAFTNYDSGLALYTWLQCSWKIIENLLELAACSVRGHSLTHAYICRTW